VVVYEMIAGRVPFDATSASRIAAQQLFAPVPPLSRHAPRVSRKIDSVMARALAKHPGDRYASASEFARAVENVLA
jgi:serine/threonine-protein kinase